MDNGDLLPVCTKKLWSLFPTKLHALLSNPIHFSSSFAAQHFHLQDRLGAIEEHSDLGQGFHVAEKDMGIRGFGSLFGEQQSGDVANVGVDLFFDMLFDSLSKVSSFTQTHIY
jgi:hypothetical protein